MARVCNNHGIWAAALMLLAASVASAESVAIVATVNEDAITTNDVAARRALVMAAAGIPATAEAEARLTPQIIQALVDERVQMQEAKRQSITVSEAELAKAIDEIGARQNLPPGEFPKMLASKGLSLRSMEEQVRAQLSWTKLVQRKLRRNVTVTQDELRRAAQAEANAPGMPEVKFAALVVPITPTSKEKDIKARVSDIGKVLTGGKGFAEIAAARAAKKDTLFSPPLWVAESKLPPELVRAFTTAKKDEVVGPLKLGNSVQFLRLLDRRVSKKLNTATEVTVKKLTLDLPAKADKSTLEKLESSATTLRADAGSCEDVTIPTTPAAVQVEFARTTLAKLAPPLAAALGMLEVGTVTEPISDGKTVTLMLLCERREPVAGVTANPALEQQLLGEKLELEAEKHLRNLRREATIELRGAQ